MSVSVGFVIIWSLYIFNNYSPKAKLILLNNYSTNNYSTILTEVNNCFSTYTRSHHPWKKKKRLVWFTGEFMREHVTVNSRCTRVGSLQYMANHSLNFFVSFSINDWKEIVESLNNSPFWEETQSFICIFQLTVNETVFFASCKCCQQRLRSRWVLFICSAVFLAMLTSCTYSFQKHLLSFFYP